jgi:excisionase family DNA binding protein
MLNTSPAKLAFSVAETCDALGLGKTNIYKLIADGKLDTVKIGGRRLVPAAAIQALLDREAYAEREGR